jgi:hypothetical protein
LFIILNLMFFNVLLKYSSKHKQYNKHQYTQIESK